MRQRIAVELVDPDETYEVVADGRDVRAWEAAYDLSYIGTPLTLTQLAQVAHLAAVRQGLFAGTWQDFDARCTGSKGLAADPTGAGGRTRKGRTGDTSAGSRSTSAASPPPSKRKAKQS